VDWLDYRHAKREAETAKARYENGLTEAKRRGASRADYDAIEGQYSNELQIIWDPIYARQSSKLIARARKYGVSVPRLPTSYSVDDANWQLGVTGDWILSEDAVDKIKRDIEIERRQREADLRNRITLFLSIIAIGISVASLLVRQKQPGPCPHNYYRNDSGECVFALGKRSTRAAAPSNPPASPISPPTTAVGSPPSITVKPAKPSPAVIRRLPNTSVLPNNVEGQK
jgi:hypothetical protein